MTTYAVLLRAVNLGSVNKVPMAAWRERLGALGLGDPVTHLQSGQAVVRTRRGADALARLVAADLREGFGVDTAVLVRTHAELQRVVDGCPWPEAAATDPTTVHVAFVDEVPTSGWVVEDPGRYAPEQAAVGDGVVYLHHPLGAGRSRMPAGKGGAATARNWRTVLRLLELTA